MPAAVSGVLAATILAGGVTSVVAIVMMVVSQYRADRLTRARGALSVSLAIGVMALAGLGVASLSPVSAQAVTTATTHSIVDVQLPTE